MSDNQPSSDATLPSEVAIRLLDLLSSDDDFRELFAKNPHAALAQAGYVWGQPGNEDNDRKLDDCCNVKSLASKAVIQEAREELQHMLTDRISQTTPNLDAGLDQANRSLK